MAQPYHHRHRHADKHAVRDAGIVLEERDDNVVIVYELEGKQISEADVQQGLQNGTLRWSNGAIASAATSSSPSPTPTPSPSSSKAAPSSSAAPSTSSAPSSSAAPSTTAAPSSSAAASSSAAPSSSAAKIDIRPVSTSNNAKSDDSKSNNDNSNSNSGTGVSKEFPDGQNSCSDFPSDYGAIALNYLGLNGWSGIQTPGSSQNGFSDINTAKQGGCTEGAYCSYACPMGYQKAQWPSMQGATGQSVGGLLCKGGKLYKTSSSQKTLCMKGTDKVTVKVKNNLQKNAAICRTDYPGTEAETIPTNTQPGQTVQLTCPDGDNYYTWSGGKTSAQYYVNNQGVSQEDACQWGDGSQPVGNWAPLNLGVGYSAGAAWLAIFQNKPTTTAKLDFTVTIKGDNEQCRYQNGKYCKGSNFSDCNDGDGCTVRSAAEWYRSSTADI